MSMHHHIIITYKSLTLTNHLHLQTLVSFHSLLSTGPTFAFNNSSIFWFCDLLSWEAGNKTINMQKKFQNVSGRTCRSSILSLTNSHNAVKSCEWKTGSDFVERMCVCVNQEAIERKEKRARRFHFCGEESSGQRNVLLDKDMMKKGKNPKHVCQTSDCSQVPVCNHCVCSSSVVLSYTPCASGGNPHDRCGRHEHTGRLWIFQGISSSTYRVDRWHILWVYLTLTHAQSQYWPQFSFSGGCGQVGAIWSLQHLHS